MSQHYRVVRESDDSIIAQALLNIALYHPEALNPEYADYILGQAEEVNAAFDRDEAQVDLFLGAVTTLAQGAAPDYAGVLDGTPSVYDAAVLAGAETYRCETCDEDHDI